MERHHRLLVLGLGLVELVSASAHVREAAVLTAAWQETPREAAVLVTCGAEQRAGGHNCWWSEAFGARHERSGTLACLI
jgi:hypothetical protein